MRSLLGAPGRGRGRVFGNIYVTEKQGADAFDADDERALEVLATQAGVAVENARLSEEMVRKSGSSAGSRSSRSESGSRRSSTTASSSRSSRSG